MSTNQKLLLNQNLTNERVSMPYPHIMLLQLTDAVPLLLPELPPKYSNFPIYHQPTLKIQSVPSVVFVLRPKDDSFSLIS